jgi:hypothetical protein
MRERFRRIGTPRQNLLLLLPKGGIEARHVRSCGSTPPIDSMQLQSAEQGGAKKGRGEAVPLEEY